MLSCSTSQKDETQLLGHNCVKHRLTTARKQLYTNNTKNLLLLLFKNCVWFRRKEREVEVTHPPSLCLCVSFSVSYKDTLIGFGVHFKLILILTLITSAKLLLPNKVTFWVPGDMDIWETLFTHSTFMLAQKLKNLHEMQETQVQSWVRKIP